MKSKTVDQYEYRRKIREWAIKRLIDVGMCLRGYGYSPIKEESTWTIALGLSCIEFQYPLNAWNMLFLKGKERKVVEYNTLHGKGDHKVFLMMKSKKGEFNGLRKGLQFYRIHPLFFSFLVKTNRLNKIFSKDRVSELMDAYLNVELKGKKERKRDFDRLRRELSKAYKKIGLQLKRYSNMKDKHSSEYERVKTMIRHYLNEAKTLRNKMFDIIRESEERIEGTGDWLKG